MLEVEMKFPVRDFAAVETRLAQIDAHLNCTRHDIDQYFNAPDRDFAQTDEALRIRRIGSANFVTYKGPKLDARTKTRTEVEVPLGDGAATAEAFAQVLTHLGYRPVAVVQKRRRLYHLERNTFSLEVTLDEVQGVGPFVEIETQAPAERLDEARRVVLELATALGLTTSERRSYLELLLEAQGKR